MTVILQGVLRIEVLEAKDLIKKDIGVFKKGSSDPYAILQGMFVVKAICTKLCKNRDAFQRMF